MAQPGDRICGNCSEANDPTRKFCRRCGTTLVNAEIVGAKKLPWWKRLFRRQPKQYAAGERTKGMSKEAAKAAGGGGGRIGKIIAAVLMLAIVVSLAGYVAVPSFQGMVNSALSGAVNSVSRIINPKFVHVYPIPSAVTTSDQLAGHPASQMFDTYSNTDWRANGQQPSVTVKFDQKFDLGVMHIFSGASDNFAAFRRPKTLLFNFSDGSSVTVDLQDDKTMQTMSVAKNGIDSFTMTVTATYGPTNQPLVISEIEVYAKQ